MTHAPERIRLTKAQLLSQLKASRDRLEDQARSIHAQSLELRALREEITSLAEAKEALANSEELRAQIVVGHEDLKRALAAEKAYGERIRLQAMREGDDRRLTNRARTEGVLLLGVLLAGSILLMALGASLVS